MEQLVTSDPHGNGTGSLRVTQLFMDWEVLVFVNIEALGQTAETHSLVFGDSTSAPSPEPVHCAPPRSVVQQPVVERLQLHLTTSRRRHNSKFQARETALVFPRAAYRAQALPVYIYPVIPIDCNAVQPFVIHKVNAVNLQPVCPALQHMLLPCCELSRTSSKEDLPALCMAPHPADPDLGSTIDSFDASWQMVSEQYVWLLVRLVGLVYMKKTHMACGVVALVSLFV